MSTCALQGAAVFAASFISSIRLLLAILSVLPSTIEASPTTGATTTVQEATATVAPGTELWLEPCGTGSSIVPLRTRPTGRRNLRRQLRDIGRMAVRMTEIAEEIVTSYVSTVVEVQCSVRPSNNKCLCTSPINSCWSSNPKSYGKWVCDCACPRMFLDN